MIFDLDPDNIDFNSLDNVRKTFMLVFTTVIWKRIWVTASIYADHNNINITKKTVLKSIKYNLYSQSGIAESFKIYIRKALTDGYIMPNTYRNKYVKNAINLFEEAYGVIVKNDDDERGLFLTKYALSVFNKNRDTQKDEHDDIIALIKSPSKQPVTINEKPKCLCDLCILVDNWDINNDILFSPDTYKNIIFRDMLKDLEKY